MSEFILIDNSKHNLGVKAFCTLNLQFYFRELSQYPAILTKQNLLYAKRAPFSFGAQWVIPSRQDIPVLPARLPNYSAGFASSCPLTKHITFTHKPI